MIRMAVGLIGTAVLAQSASAAPKAVACRVQQTSYMLVLGKKTSSDRPRTITFVIDDDSQTVSEFQRASGALVPLCKECQITYGSKEIRYSRSDDNVDGKLTDLFRLDRITGRYERDYISIGRTGVVSSMKHVGSCEPTEMPKLTDPAAKF